MSHIIAGFLFLYIACFIAAGGGIGGGGVNTPILLVVLRFTYSESVLLSLATVAGNYMAQFLLNHNLRHPAAPSRPLIYWDAVLILLPAQLGGSNIGAILLRVLPETPILIMALLVTLFAFVGTFGKLSFYIKKENDAKEKLDRESGGITHESALTLNLILNDGLVDSASAIPLAGTPLCPCSSYNALLVPLTLTSDAYRQATRTAPAAAVPKKIAPATSEWKFPSSLSAR